MTRSATTSAHRGCNDFHRASEATRRGFLGTGLTRRQVLRRGAAGGLAVYAAQTLDLGRVFEVASADAAAAPDAPVLVSVFLPGGCDLLDTLPPTAQLGTYLDLRRHTHPSNPPDLVAGSLAYHPSLAEGVGGGVAGMFARGRIGLLPGIDYANPDMSHFHSRHFWETGLITERQVPGWMGRWLDRHGSAENPLQGLSAAYDLSPVMRTGSAPVAAVASPADVQFAWRNVWGETETAANHAWDRVSTRGGANEAQAAARTAGRLARQVARRLAPYETTDTGVDPLAPAVAYPKGSDFASSLSHLAALIATPLGVRLATVDAPGNFDTHDNQPGELATSLKEVSAALSSFQADLEARGVADRVLTFVWSEFGRRPEGNDSNGTDHGAGGLAWVQGTRVNPGVLSDYPDLKNLDKDGNLKVTVDFRRVYSSLIEQWLGTDASEVIPHSGAFGRLKVVA